MKTNKKILRGTRQARWAVLIAGAMALTGTACHPTPPKDSPDTEPPTTTLGTCLYAINCPPQPCHSAVQIRQADLVTCYGWDSNTGWPQATPAEIKACDPVTVDAGTGTVDAGTGTPTCTCDGTTGVCTVTFFFSEDPVDLCGWGSEGDAASACAFEAANSSDAETLADTVNGDCGLGVNQGDPVCTTPDLSGVTLGSTACESCDQDGSTARKGPPPGTSATLSIDPAHSFLAVSTPMQSVTVRLSGNAFVDLAGGRLLGLQISADQAHFGSSDWKGFSFTLDKPVPLARAGDVFRIPVKQASTVIGIGRRDGKLTRLRATASTDVTGHLVVPQKTWDLDFADQNTAGGFAMHLVGRIAP